jgi:hexosaminidase
MRIRVPRTFARRLAGAGLALLLVAPGPRPADAAAEPPRLSLIPAPLSWTVRAEGFAPGERTLIDPGESQALRDRAEWLAGLLAEHSGREIGVAGTGDAGGAIRLARVDERELSQAFRAAGLDYAGSFAEAYSLTIGPDGVTVSAAAEAGLFYGLVSLWQLVATLPAGADAWPGIEVLDAPAFGWRGLMLDSARHLQSIAFIERYLDWMALHKLNVFHWHLTDDQAWRLEIGAWPRLAEVGGYRVPAGDAPAADLDPATGKPRLYGGYFTHAQVREVVAHAAARHITVVPEINVPGHATAAIAAYPELGVEGHGIDRVPAGWGIFPNVFNLEEATFEVLEAVLREVVELFPGLFIHLGGDEVETGQWARSARTRARMQELGIADLQSVQNYYVERLQKVLDPHGRRVIGWDEILQSDLPPHAVVMSWRGVEGAVEAAAKGHQTVLSPAPTLYLDHLQTTAADAPPGRGGVITVRDIYAFDPLPDSLGGNRERVLGLQGNLWTEHIRTEARAAYMTWPRAAAIAELGWTVPANRDWDDFARRLPDGVRRLQRLGIPAADDAYALYRQPLPTPGADNLRREDRELELCSDAIVLALEDDAPLLGERESYLVDILDPCWIWRDAPLRAAGAGQFAVQAAVGQLPFNFEIGGALRNVVVEPPRGTHGELRVRLGDCAGPIVAELPLAPAVVDPAATILPAIALELPGNAAERADLCFRFTRTGVEPIWVIDWVELVPPAP